MINYLTLLPPANSGLFAVTLSPHSGDGDFFVGIQCLSFQVTIVLAEIGYFCYPMLVPTPSRKYLDLGYLLML